MSLPMKTSNSSSTPSLPRKSFPTLERATYAHQFRPQTNVSLMAMVESLGIAPLPWHAPLDFIDVLPTVRIVIRIPLSLQLNHLQDNIRRRAVENILATHIPDISEWGVHQMRPHDEATYAISMIAVHSLLHSLENSNKFERHTCPSAAVPNSSVQLPSGPHETITSLFDWPSRVLHHGLSNFHRELDELQQSKRNTIRPPQLPTENSASTLYEIFDTYKSKSQYAKICSNMAVAAMGLRYAMEVSNVYALCPSPNLTVKKTCRAASYRVLGITLAPNY